MKIQASDVGRKVVTKAGVTGIITRVRDDEVDIFFEQKHVVNSRVYESTTWCYTHNGRFCTSQDRPWVDDMTVRFVVDVVDPTPTTSGVRHNAGKLPLHLLPVEALEAIAQVLEFGAKKYSAHNWRKGLSWSETASSALRHFYKWMRGEEIDEESGLPHMSHFACNVLFLLTFVLTKTGTDDRYKPKTEEKTA